MHLDDFYWRCRSSEMESFLQMIRTKLKLKGSEVVIEFGFEYLKRTMIRSSEGIFLHPREKHSANIIVELGLKGENAVRTPDLGSEDIPEYSPPLVDKQIGRYRSCVVSGLYLAQDRIDIRRAVGMLAADLAKPTEHSWKRLLRLGRYLVGTADLGVFMQKIDPKTCGKGVVWLRTFSDGDHGSMEAKCKITTYGVIFADGVQLTTLVRRQDTIAVSSGESEFYALSTVAMDDKMVRDLLTWFRFKVEWALETDSSAARAMSLRQGVDKVRHLDTKVQWAQQSTRLLGLKNVKCKGSVSPADICSTSRGSEVYEQLCMIVWLRRLTGEFGAIREVGVIALIDGFPQSSSILCCPTLKSAILILCLALQAQQGEAATPGEITRDDDIWLFLIMICISWIAFFMMGCAIGCWCSRGSTPAVITYNHKKGDNIVCEGTMETEFTGGCLVYYLVDENRSVHLSRECKHLKDVRGLERRLKHRSLCRTCCAEIKDKQR